eukprot:scaffold7259_cov77-Skeletonema_dohrnii-CCMP3373.AAC.6
MHKQCRPGRCVCVRHVAKDKRCGTEGCIIQAPPTREEFVCGMEQRRNDAASRNAQINLRIAQEAQGKGSRKLCSIEGCTNKACKGGLCMRHGAKVKVCSTGGYTNHAKNGGICSRHGAKNQLTTEGVCLKHGAKANLYAVKLDVQINQGKEECAVGRRNDSALRNAQSQIKLRLVLCV